MQWYIKCIKNYANFHGRARRKEYWMFYLFNFIFLGVAYTLDIIFGLPFVFYSMYSLATFMPGLAVIVRRLHDLGKPGTWGFICLIPGLSVIIRWCLHELGISGGWWFFYLISIICGIWFLILMCTDGIYGDNIYGPSPKEEPITA